MRNFGRCSDSHVAVGSRLKQWSWISKDFAVTSISFEVKAGFSAENVFLHIYGENICDSYVNSSETNGL